jgi:hypothetical protein
VARPFEFSHGLHFLGHSAFAFETALPAPLLPSNRRKLVFRSMPVTQEKETLHHPPATTSLIAAMSWLSPLDPITLRMAGSHSRSSAYRLAEVSLRIRSTQTICLEWSRLSQGCGHSGFYPAQKPATRLIEANIARTNTGHCGEGQPSPLNHVVAHRFNDVGDGRRKPGRYGFGETQWKTAWGSAEQPEGSHCNRCGPAGTELRDERSLGPRSTRNTSPSHNLPCRERSLLLQRH